MSDLLGRTRTPAPSQPIAPWPGRPGGGVSTNPTTPGIDYFRQTLATWGLDSPSLIAWADEQLRSGASIERILFDMEARPEFKAAFPEIDARRNKMDQTGTLLSPIGPGEILEYRTQAKALMRSFGLPPAYYENQTVLFNLIVNDKSMAELNDALELTQRRVANAPPQIAAVFGEVFGPDALQAMFVAFANDEQSLPALEQMVQQAEAGGAARRLGFDLTAAEMGRVADIDISYEAAVQGFQTLDERRSLFDETISERTDLTVGNEGIGAAFGIGGGDAQELERRAKSRTAATAGTGGELAEQRGVTGLGTAGRR